MEEVCERENLKAAMRRVRANQGSPGVDGMTVIGIKDYLKQHGPAIREQLLNGTYEPQPVRRVEIRKPDGGGMFFAILSSQAQHYTGSLALNRKPMRWTI